ncbi:MAG TPA: beta-ketoacyl synthase N-terminal-like domain-containing protein, partial [Casimicrobiaceae bacterium]|nr:beta-ketoacyl synthase N-terminal-like domain-containing protein [Casimicrobiaceae bacterium]
MSHDYDVAIVGMAGRFPGAPDLDAFWRNLVGGVESIARLTDEEILASGVPASALADPTYVKAAPVLDEPGAFDAAFFGYSPTEARTLDPQQRLLLELAHEALEHAGCDPARAAGRIGVFAGSAFNTYYTHTGLDRRLAEDYIPTLIASDKDFLATRIAYKLDLKGPAITVQTACSTSVVAVHLARQSLLTGETDVALAGAASVRVPHRAGYFCDAGGVVSPDGHVRAFDAGANGTVFGSGGGMLVLKRLADALADGDTIHAVLRGSAVNNDGAEKAGYTAPSVNSQADAVAEALANADVDADSIGYVEAHGSGTPVGDPIEVRALTKAFRAFTQRSGYCALGSVKTNVGHLDAAAGVAGIVKTVLALEHRLLPPSLHYAQPNPEIDFAATPFFVNDRLRDWTSAGPRRAGVMSTGMGGTNAHVVLEEAPPPPAATPDGRPRLLVLSARSEAALERATDRLHGFLQCDGVPALADVAYTLQ